VADYGRLAKRTTDGLICRLLLIGLWLVVVVTVTTGAMWFSGASVAVPETVGLALVLWGSFGAAQWISERRVDESNALARLATASAVRTFPPLVVVVMADAFWQPGLVHLLAPFLLVAYATTLGISTWLTGSVLRQHKETNPVPASGRKPDLSREMDSVRNVEWIRNKTKLK
jgi:hypothetical protein